MDNEPWTSSKLETRILNAIRERGPMTVAAFMELALYDSDAGYYARAARRSGRAGDFFTSVDVGPLFGELLESQIAEMLTLLEGAEAYSTAEDTEDAEGSHSSASPAPSAVIPSSASSTPFDLVEAAAGNGRLSRDILCAARRRGSALYNRIRLHLIEASAEARAAQRDVLGDVGDRLVSSGATLPDAFEGILVANELLDAMPVHQVVMRHGRLLEVFVTAVGDRLTTCEGEPSTPELADYLAGANVTLETGSRAEVNLHASEWIRDVARRLRRGFVILIDYGHDARELYSPAHAGGTLTTFARHTMSGPEQAGEPAWLGTPGDRDITAHVDFTGVRLAAEESGFDVLGLVDQTYFLLGLADPAQVSSGSDAASVKRRLALKTLMMPGGLGSTHKVLLLGKNVGTPSLRGCSFSRRMT